MRRDGVALVAAVLVLAGCGGTTSTDPLGSAVPVPPASESPVVSPSPSDSPPPMADANRPTYYLLPRSCTKDDGVHVVSAAADGATGHYLNRWRIKSRTPCTLNGTPRVALFEANGQRAVTHKAKYFDGGRRPHPVAIGPAKSVRVAISTYRCDVTHNPPSLTTARFDFAPNGRREDSDATVTAKLKLPTPYCPQEYPEDVGVAPIGSLDFKPHAIYVASMKSSYDPWDMATWGSADIDGDGTMDTVILEPPVHRGGDYGRMAVDLNRQVFGPGKVKSSNTYVPFRFMPGTRLQALPDLNGDGRAEIVIASPSDPAGVGYYNGVTNSLVYTLAGRRIQKVGGKHLFRLSVWARGDQAKAVACHGDEFTEVYVNIDYQPTRIVRTTYHLEGATPVRVSRTVSTSSQNSYDLLSTNRSECPGMGADGWAASD